MIGVSFLGHDVTIPHMLLSLLLDFFCVCGRNVLWWIRAFTPAELIGEDGNPNSTSRSLRVRISRAPPAFTPWVMDLCILLSGKIQSNQQHPTYPPPPHPPKKNIVNLGCILYWRILLDFAWYHLPVDPKLCFQKSIPLPYWMVWFILGLVDCMFICLLFTFCSIKWVTWSSAVLGGKQCQKNQTV